MDQKQIEENYKAAIALLNIREEQIGELLNEKAAEQKMHPTAYWAGLMLFILGFMLGAEYVLYRLGGG